MERPFFKKISSHSFLLRMVLSSLLFVMIPVLILVILLVNKDYKNMENMQIETANKNMRNATVKFESYLTDLRIIAIRIMIDKNFEYSYLQEHTYNEVMAIDWLQYSLFTVPYVQELGIYFTDTDYLYTSTGKYSMDVYEEYILFMRGFDEYINDVSTSKVMGTHDGLEGNRIIYMYPLSTYYTGKQSAKVMFFTLNKESFQEMFATTLPDEYTMLSIFDPRGNHIYFDKQSLPFGVTDEKYLELFAEGQDENTIEKWDHMFFRATGSTGYEIIASMPEQPFMHEVEIFRKSTIILVIIMMFICLVLVVLMVWIDYIPIRKMVKTIAGKYKPGITNEQDSGELDMVFDIMEQNTIEKKLYQEKLGQQNDMMIVYNLQRLLDAKTLTIRQKTLLDMERGQFIVVLTSIKNFPNINTIKNKLNYIKREDERINMLEIPFEGYILFSCSVLDEHRETSLALIDDMRLALDVRDCKFGCSNAFRGTKQFYQAYLEAACALEQLNNTQKTLFFEEHSIANLTEEQFYSEQMIKLAQFVKIGNMSKALSTLAEVFDILFKHSDSAHIRLYYSLNMAKAYIDFMKDIELTNKEMWLNKINDNTDVEDIHKKFIAFVKTNCNEIKESRKQFESKQASEILAFADENYTDTQICLDMIYDKFNVMDYMVSRIFKDLAGVGFRKYIINKRIEYSKELLGDKDKSINDIAELTGFSSSSYFIRIFKDHEGITPVNYRNLMMFSDGESLKDS